MRLLATVTDWWKWGSQHKLTAAVIHSSARIGASLAAQVPAAGQAALSVITHPPTQRIAKHLFRVTVVDLGGLVLLTYINQQIQSAGRAYLGEETDNGWLSANMVLQAGLASIEVASQMIYIRNRLKLQAHTVLLNLESPVLSKTDTSDNICEQEHCATVDYFKGSLRDLISFWAIEIALLTAERLPIPGAAAITYIARIQHNGRFIVTVAKSARCYDHQLIYLKDEPETAFALGLGHAINTFLINTALERLTGLSSLFYYPIMQLMLIPQISVAAHMKLTDIAVSSKNTTWDLIALYQEGTDVLIETFALGIEQQIKSRLQEKSLLPTSFSRFFKNLPNSKLAQLMYWAWHQPAMHLVLPKLLQTTDHFIQDPIVRDNWPEFQTNFIGFLKALETHKRGTVVKVASAMPGTSLLIRLYFGIPEAVTKLLLTLINDQTFMTEVTNLRFKLENLKIEKPMGVRVNYESSMLDGVIEPSALHTETLPDSSPLTDADEIIRKGPRHSSAPVDGVIRVKAPHTMGLRHRLFQNSIPNPPLPNESDDDFEDDFVHATLDFSSTNA